jgi:hypothetical protein
MKEGLGWLVCRPRLRLRRGLGGDEGPVLCRRRRLWIGEAETCGGDEGAAGLFCAVRRSEVRERGELDPATRWGGIATGKGDN